VKYLVLTAAMAFCATYSVVLAMLGWPSSPKLAHRLKPQMGRVRSPASWISRVGGWVCQSLAWRRPAWWGYGRARSWPAWEEVAGWAVVVGLVGTVLSGALRGAVASLGWLTACAGCAAAAAGYLKKDWAEARRRLQAELPIFFRAMARLSQSGLTLREAAQCAIDLLDTHQALRDVLVTIRSRLAAGLVLSEALAPVADMCVDKDLVTPVLSVLDGGERLGVPVAAALEHYAQLCSDRNRYRWESRLGRMPVYLSGIMIFFFLPSMFVLVLFPNLLSFLENW